MEERLTDLELRFMQQEKTLQDLSDVVYRQEQQIVTLEGGASADPAVAQHGCFHCCRSRS